MSRDVATRDNRSQVLGSGSVTNTTGRHRPDTVYGSTSVLLALALAAAPVGPATKASPTTGTRGKSPAGPRGRAAKPQRQTAPRIPRAKKRAAAVRPTRDATAEAAMAGLIQRAGRGKAGKRLERSLRRHGVSLDDARALASAGGEGGPGRAALVEGIARADAVSLVDLNPVIALPPEDIPLPSTFALESTGIVTTQTDDADGTDALSAVAIVVTPEGQEYVVDAVDLGSANHSVGSRTWTRTVFDAAPADALVVTALFEGDSASTSHARAELETLVAIAASVAETMPGDDRLQVLRAMVDYTIALDDLNDPASAAKRSVASASVAQAQWSNLWATEVSEDGGVRWKVAIPHSIGSGRYELLLNVPDQLPEMSTVRVSLSDLDVHVPEGMHAYSVTVVAGIGNEAHTFDLDKPRAVSLKAIERKVIAGEVTVSVEGRVRYGRLTKEEREAHLERCADPPNALAARRCRGLRRPKTYNRDLDFAAGHATRFIAEYSTTLGGFVPAQDAKAGPRAPTTREAPKRKAIRTRRASGNETPRGFVKVTATDR